MMRGAQSVACMLGVAMGTLAAAGVVYEAVSERRDRRIYPPPGELVDMGGYRLHITHAGAGGPTVVLDAGLAGFSLDWGLVTPEIARFTTVYAYDRAGYGWSEAGPLPRTSVALARELHTLLERAQAPAPYVLVGHSFAGYTLRIFADAYPDEVAGMVLVDASQEGLVERLTPEQLRSLFTFDRIAKVGLRAGRLLASFGVVRLAGKMGLLTLLHPFTLLPTRERAEAFAFRYTPRFFRTSLEEYQDFPVSGEQARRMRGLGDKPLIALSAIGSDATPADGETPSADGSSLLAIMARIGATLQGESAASLSTRATHILTDKSGHQVAITQPQLVIDAVRQVVDIARTPEHQQTASIISTEILGDAAVQE